jgi:universal stress protein E
MNRIDHILVIVDPCAAGRQASVDKAALLARSFDASVELLVCDIESAIEDDALVLPARKTRQSNTQLLDLLDGLAAPLRAEGLAVSVRLIYGESLHDSLLDYIRGSNADIVAKDTHHHSYARRTFLRNTDWHLVHGSTVPVLLTKSKEWSQPPVVMAAIDPAYANEHSEALDRRILTCAASLAGRLSGDLQVIHTYIPAALAAAVAGGTLRTTPESMQGVQVENALRCCQIEHLANTCGVKPECLHVEMGTPEDRLSDSVTKYHAAVMVMGASSHGRWHRMLVGSTLSTVLESLPCDIIVIRPPYDKSFAA